MTCHNWKDMMMGYLDNELDQEQKIKFEEHLKGCPECKKELEEFKTLKSITDDVSLAEPEDRLWKDYWNNVYNRMELGIGWIIFSIAAIILLIFGGFHFIEAVGNNAIQGSRTLTAANNQNTQAIVVDRQSLYR